MTREPSTAPAQVVAQVRGQARIEATSIPSRAARRPPGPSWLRIALRVLAWTWALLRYELWVFARALATLEDPSSEWRARSMRAVIRRMDPSAVYMARLLAGRLDAFPHAYANELLELRAEAPPLSIREATEAIEGAAGAPLREVYLQLDLEAPLRSDALSCVYEATLLDGTPISLSVKRAEADARLQAERRALLAILRAASGLWPGRYELLSQIAEDLEDLLHAELDYIAQRRVQELLREAVREDRLKGIRVARTFAALSDSRVLARERLEGIELGALVAALEGGSPESVEALRPGRVARRLLRLHFWTLFESAFLFGSPDLGHLLVCPDGALAILEVRESATLGRHERGLLRSLHEALARHEIEAASESILALLSPLPPVDHEELQRRLDGRIGTELLGIESSEAAWWVRSGAGLWVALLTLAREYGVSVSLELSLAIRACCLNAQLACRLCPGRDLLSELSRYRCGALKRSARQAVGRFREPERYGGSRFISQPEEARSTLRRVVRGAQGALERPPLSFLSQAKKGAYSLAETLRAALSLGRLTILLLVILSAYSFFSEGEVHPAEALWAVLRHPAYVTLLILLLVAAVRRVLYRLDDLDRGA